MVKQIVASRLIRFNEATWGWAKRQDNLSDSIRKLINTQLIGVSRGRPPTNSAISDLEVHELTNSVDVKKKGVELMRFGDCSSCAKPLSATRGLYGFDTEKYCRPCAITLKLPGMLA
ncbi:hypothetical protein LCGC14_1741810 [marine sediment metagenome]|uniref:Uncharacterized protein n=1 Tax=marine sediment metagenome TaxID=412755 RepID=A0A0F9JLN6_9ZZZZ